MKNHKTSTARHLATDRTPFDPSLNPVGTFILLLGLVLVILAASATAIMVHDYGDPMFRLGCFTWAINPAGVLILVTTSHTPVLRLARKHPFILYGIASIFSIATIAYFSIMWLDVMQLYLSIMTYGSATLLAGGVWLVSSTPIDRDGRPRYRAETET